MPVPTSTPNPEGTPHYGRPTSVSQRGDVRDYAARGTGRWKALQVVRCRARDLRSSDHADHL
jgi:hypothetical protein